MKKVKKGLSVMLAGVLMVSLLFPMSELLIVPAKAEETKVKDVKYFVSQDLGAKKREAVPTVNFSREFGLDEYGYPTFGGNFDKIVEDKYKAANPGATADDVKAEILRIRKAVSNENEAIMDYDGMDANGNLKKNGVLKTKADDKTVIKLIKHTAGVANYGKKIPDSAESRHKKLSLRMTSGGNIITGLYAPPGEVVTIKLNGTSHSKDAKDLGLRAYIGTWSAGSGYKRIDPVNVAKVYSRMPRADKDLPLNQQINYVGSPLGGPIYIGSNGIGGTTVELEIEGAVEMPYYIQGETTDAQLTKMLAEAPGPYFDFSTVRGIRMMGPSTALSGLNTSFIKKGIDFWDKAINVSYQFGTGHFSDGKNQDSHKMSIIFEAYIPAGAAVNMGGAYCICPTSWARNMLNADAYITGGGWGNMHEINHSFKWGGMSDSVTEISNNVINALTYNLYTNIAASREEGPEALKKWMGDWIFCTDAYTTMEKIRGKRKSGKADNLEAYIPPMHSFGSDRFLKMVQVYRSNGGQPDSMKANDKFSTNSDVWLYASSSVSGYDMTYYMNDVLGFPIKEDTTAGTTDYITKKVISRVKGDNAPVYIPSGILYQSGYVYDKDGAGNKEAVELGRAFRIPFALDKKLDLNMTRNGGYLSVPDGVNAEYVSHTQPVNGSKVEKTGAMTFLYKPNTEKLEDYFDVTMKLTILDGDYKGRSENVTYRLRFLQDTGGFTTKFYSWPKPANYNTAIRDALDGKVLEQEVVGEKVSNFVGFDVGNADTKYHNSFAVVEGKVKLNLSGELDLYTRGDDIYQAFVGASEAELDDRCKGVPQAHYEHDNKYMIYELQPDNKKEDAKKTRIKIYVVPKGGSQPANRDDYALILNEGDMLYMRGYVINTGGPGNFRMGYLSKTTDASGTISYEVKDFPANMVLNLKADTNNLTPAKADYPTDKVYSYQDDTYRNTVADDVKYLDSPFISAKVYTPGTTQNLPTYSGKPEDIIDGNTNTMYHAKPGQSAADFIFETKTDPYNGIYYAAHKDFPDRGKIEKYEIYASDNLEELLKADRSSPCFVQEGTIPFDRNKYSRILLKKDITNKYLRISAKSCYPTSTGQRYVAISDIKLAYRTQIDGLGRIEEMDKPTGDWTLNEFTNTRNGLMETNTAEGVKTFKGVGIMMYSAKGPAYGKMMVKLDDNDPKEINLNDPKNKYQQLVFWANDLDYNKTHTLKFWPKDPSNKINVEYFEVKNPDYQSKVPVRPQDVVKPVYSGSGTYSADEAATKVTSGEIKGTAGVPIEPIQAVQQGGTGGGTYTAAGLPEGLSIDGATGKITGKPTAEGSGTYTVTYTTQGKKSTTSAAVKYTIAKSTSSGPVTPPPVQDEKATSVDFDGITAGVQQEWTVNKAVMLKATQKGGTTGGTYSAEGLPTGLKLDSTTGAITGAPTAEGNGTITVKYTTPGGKETASPALKYAVLPGAAPPPNPPNPPTTQSGNLTISNPVQGVTYELYKIFDITDVNTAGGTTQLTYGMNDVFGPKFYDADGPLKDYLSDVQIVNVNTSQGVVQEVLNNKVEYKGKTSWINITDRNVRQFADDIIPLVKDLTPVATWDADGSSSYTFDKLEPGYYAIYPSNLKDGVMVNIANHPQNGTKVKLKTIKPETYIKKTLNKTGGYDVGETAYFALEGKVPGTEGFKDYWYRISDEMTSWDYTNQGAAPVNVECALTLDTTSIKVMAGGKLSTGAGKLTTMTGGTDVTDQFTVDATDTGFTIKVNVAKSNKLSTMAYEDLLVTYNARVKESMAKANHFSKNTATLTTPKSSTGTDENKTVVSGYMHSNLITISKVSKGGVSALENAEFVLTKQSAAGGTLYYRYTAANPATGTAAAVTWEAASAAATRVTSRRQTPTGPATAVFQGLSDGEYTVKEVKTPDDTQYKLADPQAVTVKGIIVPGAGGITVSADIQLQIENLKHNETSGELPATGGFGATLLYILGGTILTAVLTIALTRRRLA